MANQRNESTQRQPANGKDLNPIASTISDMGEGNGIEKAKETAKTLFEQAKSTAGDAYESVAEKATASIEEKKAGLSGGLTSVADSIRKVGENLNQTAEQTPVTEYSARYAQTAAQKIEDVARYFDTKDLKSVARDVEMYARRNPAIFLGGAFALGVLAARFFKSSPRPAIKVAGTAPDHQLTAGNNTSEDLNRGATPGTI